MLLESLARSARDNAGTEPGCIRQKAHWRLDLDAHGRPVRARRALGRRHGRG